jgi:hypothetical protein
VNQGKEKIFAAKPLPKVANFSGLLVHLSAFVCFLADWPLSLYSCGFAAFCRLSGIEAFFGTG